MEVNLAIIIMSHILVQQSAQEGRSVKLSEYMQEYGIPRATFYRHVRTLLDNRIIEKYGRDRYGMHRDFVSKSRSIREYSRM